MFEKMGKGITRDAPGYAGCDFERILKHNLKHILKHILRHIWKHKTQT